MSLNALRKGITVLIGSAQFVILKKLDLDRWQLENTATGEWCAFTEHDLLDRFANTELVFVNRDSKDGNVPADRALASYSPDLIAAAQKRVQYLKEIDRNQPIPLTRKGLESLGQRRRQANRRCSATELADALPRLSQMAGCGPRHSRRHPPSC